MNDTVEELAIGPDDTLYAGGQFTTAGGNSVNYIASWNGTSWSALGSGVNGIVYALEVGLDGTLYVGGTFSSAGGISLADKMARWNGSSWAHLDINLPGTPTVYVFFASKSTEPVTKRNYDLLVGYSTTGTGYFAGLITATNDGTPPVFPKIVFYRSGGTSATIETLRNEFTGKELYFNYPILAEETLTIDLAPFAKSITSSFFGSRLDAILSNSDFGTWTLLQGDNDVTSFVNVSGATITAWMQWRTAYVSWD